MMKNTIFEAILIISAAISIALVVNAIRPGGIDLFAGRDAPVSQNDESPARMMAIDDAIKKFSESGPLFVDARSADDYFSGHIPGAVSLPDYFFDDLIEDFITEIDPQTEIITYCSSIDCHQAQDLAEKLCFAGFEHVSYFADGLSRWTEYGMPVQKDLDNAISR